MNLNEGTRRLALLLGGAGAILCGMLSYTHLQSVMRRKADNNRFEQLANSELVSRARQMEQGEQAPPKGWPPTVPYAHHFHYSTEVDEGGIKKIYWNRRYEVETIETADGQGLHPMPAPSAWSYVVIAMLPLFGFVVPWCAVRAIDWVGTGFAEGSQGRVGGPP